jgi:hypothetical protein
MSAAASEHDRQSPKRHWLDAERLRVYPIIVLTIFALTMVWWTWRSLPGLVDPEGKPLGYDFIAFWSAAKLAVEGRAADAFNWSAMTAMHHVAVPLLPADKLFLWHYPPTYLLMVLPLGLMSYVPALILFVAATAGLWVWLARSMFADRRAWLVAAAFPAGLLNVMHGQNGFLTAALAGFALLALDRRPILSGVLVGLLAVKPHLAILFPIALIAEARWRTFISAAATAVSFTIVSVAVFGWSFVAIFLHDLTTVRQLVDGGNLPWGMIPSPYVFALSLGANPAVAMALQVGVAIGAVVCVWIAWRNPTAPFEAKAATLVIGSMLVSPYVFYYDLTWQGLAIAWLTILGLRDGFYRYERELLVAAYVSPMAMYGIRAATHVQIGFPVLLALLWMAAQRGKTAPIATQDHLSVADPPVPDGRLML